jgi:membrane-associated phospholipid phosphatase
LRAFGPWIAVALSYGLMRYLVPLVHPTVYDQTLRACEEWLWGWDSAHFFRFMANERWTAFLCLLYLSVFAWLVAFFLYLILRRSRLFQRAMVGLLLLYAGGFFGYMLFPAEGPRYAFAGEWDFLDGTGLIASLTNAVVSHMGSHLDVFPSLHAAFVAYLLLWQAARRPNSLVWGFPLAVGVWFSTLYLGFHYFPDFIGGWLLGVFSFYAAPLLEGKLTALNGLLPASQRAETPAESAA